MPPASSNAHTEIHTHTHTHTYIQASKSDNGTIDLTSHSDQPKSNIHPRPRSRDPAEFLCGPYPSPLYVLPHPRRGSGELFEEGLFLEAWPQRLQSLLSAAISHGEALVKPVPCFSPCCLPLLKDGSLIFCFSAPQTVVSSETRRTFVVFLLTLVSLLQFLMSQKGSC